MHSSGFYFCLFSFGLLRLLSGVSEVWQSAWSASMDSQAMSGWAQVQGRLPASPAGLRAAQGRRPGRVSALAAAAVSQPEDVSCQVPEARGQRGVHGLWMVWTASRQAISPQTASAGGAAQLETCQITRAKLGPDTPLHPKLHTLDKGRAGFALCRAEPVLVASPATNSAPEP